MTEVNEPEPLASSIRQKERRETEKRITQYYDRLSDEERREEGLWGDFATREFLSLER